MPDEEGLLYFDYFEQFLQGPAGQEVRSQSDRADIMWGREGRGEPGVVSEVGGRRLGDLTPPLLQQDLSLRLVFTTGHRADWFQHS